MCTVRSTIYDDTNYDQGPGSHSRGATPLRALCAEGAFSPSVVRSLEGRGVVAELNGEPPSRDDLADALARASAIRG
jgi:hypothetical protein